MARPLRIEYQDAWYHVMNRGRRGEFVFADSEDYELFIALLRETSEMFAIRISAFCLMSNHYHILMQTPAGNLSRAMRHINGVYTQRYNRRRNADGQLFRGRYKSVLVEEDSHLLEILRYIHRNPVRAHICSAVGEYPWSSHPGYVSSAKEWDWLHKEFLLGMFSREKDQARSHYKNFVQGEESSEVTDFFSRKNLPSFFGSQDFIDLVKSNCRELQCHDEIPQSRDLAPTIAEIRKTVCQCYEIDERNLERSKRGQVNEPRNVAVYLARKQCGLRLEEIGQEFGIRKYSTVSSIVTRTDNQLAQDKHLRNRLEEIRLKIDKKSQDK